MEKVLIPRGSKVSFYGSQGAIEQAQTRTRVNQDRRIKCLVEDFGILTSLVSGLCPDNDYRVTEDPSLPGCVLVDGGVALAHDGSFGNDYEIYFLYNDHSQSVEIPAPGVTYQLNVLHSGIYHTYIDVVNGFLYAGGDLIAPHRYSDGIQFYWSDTSYDPAPSGVILANVFLDGAGAVTITDRRNENVLTLRSILLDEDVIFKKDRDNTTVGAVTILNDLTVSGVSTLAALTAGDATITDLTVANGLTAQTPAQVRIAGVRNYPFKVGVGVTGTYLDPLGGLEVMTVDPAPPIPKGLKHQTGLMDDNEVPPDQDYPILPLNPSSPSMGQTMGRSPVPILIPNAWAKVWFGDYQHGGIPNGTWNYQVSPSPLWAPNLYTGNYAVIYNGSAIEGVYLIDSNSTDTLMLSGIGSSAPVTGTTLLISPLAYEYQWKFRPINLADDPTVWGGGGTQPDAPQYPFPDEPDLVQPVYGQSSPTKQSVVYEGLKVGARFGVRVRSVSKTGEMSQWSDGGYKGGWYIFTAGLTESIVMTPVSAIPLQGGIKLSWAEAKEATTGIPAMAYQIVWTEDNSTPDFDDPSQKKSFTSETNFIVESEPGKTIRGRVRAITRGLLVSDNSAYFEEIAGGSRVSEPTKLWHYYLYKDPDIHNDAESRMVAYVSVPNGVIISRITVTLYRWLVTEPDRWCKIRVYIGDETNGFSLRTTSLGQSIQHGLLYAPAATTVMIDAWDGTDAGLRTGFEGELEIETKEAPVIDPAHKNKVALGTGFGYE